MSCPTCGRDLPVAFPGATVTCACGRELALPSRPSSSGSGPYRSASAVAGAAEVRSTCPYCSNAIAPLVRLCPHCDVRLDRVRCARCFSLQQPGAFACGRCGEPMELEPLLDATDAPCPRCSSPLEVASHGGDARTHECPRCGGMFVAREALAEILCRAELGGRLAHPPERGARALDEVRYLPCPLCHATMNRANFGKVSGVIVDVCRKHGTWFDAGELTRIVAFVAGGGLEKSRQRESAERRAEERRHAEAHAHAMAAVAEEEVADRLDFWRELLAVILRG